MAPVPLVVRSLITLLILAAPAIAEPPPGFRALFNGQDLTGWWGVGTEDPAAWMALPEDQLEAKREASLADIRDHWRVEGDELVNDGQGLYLTTLENFGDFELLVEYKTVAQADSGIYLRGVPQVQIWDYTEEGGKWNIGADKGSGGLWNNSPGAPGKDPLVFADHPFGEWNQFRIVMVGERVWIHLNDRLIVDGARLENYFDRAGSVPREGPIQLQTHGGEIRWRNIYIREIDADETIRLLADRDSDGFEYVFDGRTFDGWAGAVDSYVIENGDIMCAPGSGGNLYTEAEYGDFTVRLEFLLPPGGNNGLAIRYPGEGTPAYAGMCELQVLDNTADKYATLDDRQYHGSVYGQVAARRGYLRPPNVWNFQEVTVEGPRMTVELNGTVILDADISEVTDFMSDPAGFTGRERATGHFGFAGHNDPVRFRNIRIREID